MTRNRFYTWEKYKDLNSFTLNRDKGLFKKEFVKIILIGKRNFEIDTLELYKLMSTKPGEHFEDNKD